jgi:hypothetical protein
MILMPDGHSFDNKIADITIKDAFPPGDETKKALNHLLAAANGEHIKGYPRAEELDW